MEIYSALHKLSRYLQGEITKALREKGFSRKSVNLRKNIRTRYGIFSDLIQYGYLSNALAACPFGHNVRRDRHL